jgi:hypothetical protein
MDIEANREEVTVRLLSNGRYVWTITKNDIQNPDTTAIVKRLKALDGSLRDSFPNHVKESSVRFHEVSDE